MTQASDNLPIACSLSGAALRRRVSSLMARITSAAVEIEELPDGLAFRVPGDRKWMALVVAWIAAERECCRFLTFELSAQPNLGPVCIRLTGPPGSKEFLKGLYGQGIRQP